MPMMSDIRPHQVPSMTLRRKLRSARAGAELTQEQLGDKLNRSRYVIRYWEITGNIPGEALGGLCDALDVDMEYWRV